MVATSFATASFLLTPKCCTQRYQAYPQTQAHVYRYAHSTLTHTFFFTLLHSTSGALSSNVTSEVDATVLPRPLYAEYLELWTNLFDATHSASLFLSPGQREALLGKLYDALLRACTYMVAKLNTSYSVRETQGAAVELVYQNPKDAEIFDNFCTFVGLFVPSCATDFFPNWVYVFSEAVISKLLGSPMVSGYYRLLTLVLKTAKEVSYFSGLVADGLLSGGTLASDASMAPSGPTADDGSASPSRRQRYAYGGASVASGSNLLDAVEDAAGGAGLAQISEVQDERAAAFVLVSKTAREVLAAIREYKGELLRDCLEFVLSLPTDFVDVRMLVGAFQTTLRLGVSDAGLAVVGLNALEYWHRVAPRALDRVLGAIIPTLNDYLLVRESEGLDEDAVAEEFTAKAVGLIPGAVSAQRRPPSRSGRKRQDVRLETGALGLSNRDVQLRVIRFLGRIGGANHAMVKDDLEAAAEKSLTIKWDQTERVKFGVSFADVKTEVYLDSLLPRIIELASSSANRQSKVAACEALHSLVHHILGTAVAQTHIGDYTMEAVYERLFPAILRLAVDGESVARQLFEPLAFQLVRWFSRPGHATTHHRYRVTLLEAVCEALGGEGSDSALRTIGAKCVGVFMVYAIKQSTKAEIKNDPVNIHSLLRRVYALARHPNPYKRLGAAEALLEIYRPFREEKDLVDRFVFEMLDTALLSLRLADSDAASFGTVPKLHKVIRKIHDMLAHWAPLNARLFKASRKRAAHTDLGACLEWLFGHLSVAETECRHACMELFTRLTTLVPGECDFFFFFF